MPSKGAFRHSKKSLKILSRKGRKSEGKRGVGGGCGNVVNPIGFSIISTAGARGGDFLFKAPEGPLLTPPSRRHPAAAVSFATFL